MQYAAIINQIQLLDVFAHDVETKDEYSVCVYGFLVATFQLRRLHVTNFQIYITIC